MKKLTVPDYLFLGLLIVLSLVFYRLLIPFFMDIVLALMLMQVFLRVQVWMRRRFHVPTRLSALLCVLTALISIIVPLVITGVIAYKELAQMYYYLRLNWSGIQHFFTSEGLHDLCLKYPALAPLYQLDQIIDIDQQLARGFPVFVHGFFKFMEKTVIDMGIFLLHLIIILALLFFLLNDGYRLLRILYRYMPLKEHGINEILANMTRMVDATLLGTLVIGIIEACYGGLMLIVFRIPSPVLGAIAIFLFSILPILGMQFILIPIALLIIFTGHVPSGILFLVLGLIGSLFTQQYLRPYLIGKQGGVHPGIVLLSILGGMAWFGPAGFLIGPIIAALFVSAWEQFGVVYRPRLDNWKKGQE